MRIRDWYFQGWERREDENGRSRLVYTGEYYSLPEEPKRLRAVCAGLAAAIIAVYAVLAFFPTAGGRWHYAAIPQLMELIPLIYLVMGIVCLLRAKEKMTFRDWYASWRRTLHAAAWSAGFACAMALVQIAYLIVIGAGGAPGAELLYLAGELVCAALGVGLFLYIRKHPCRQSM